MAFVLTAVMIIIALPLNAFAASNVFYSISPGSEPLRGYGSGSGSSPGYPAVTTLGYGVKWGIKNVMTADGKDLFGIDLTSMTEDQAYTQINEYATNKYQKQYISSKAGVYGVEHTAAQKIRGELGDINKVEAYEPDSNPPATNPGRIKSILAYNADGTALPGNYAGDHIYNNYIKDGKPLNWEEFKRVYLDGTPATIGGAPFDKGRATYIIQQLSQGGSDIDAAVKNFMWQNQSDKGKTVAGYLGLLATIYKATDPSVSKYWDQSLKYYVDAMSDPVKAQNFHPVMVTVEIVTYMGFDLGTSSARVVALTLPQYYSLMFNQKEYLFYDWLSINLALNKPSTYDAIRKVHDFVASGVGGKGIDGCCTSRTSWLREQTINASGIRVYAGDHDGNKYPANPPTNTGGEYGRIKSGNLNGFGVFGAAIIPTQLPPPTEVTPPKGRFGIEADPHAKQVTKNFTEAVDLDVSIHQLYSVPADKADEYDNWSTWLKFFDDVAKQSKEQGATPTYQLVFYVKSTKNEAEAEVNGPGTMVTGNSANFTNGVKKQISLEDLKKLMSPDTKDVETFTAIVKDIAPTKYWWKAGVDLVVQYNGVDKFWIELVPDPKFDMTVFTTDAEQPHYYSEVATPYAEIKTGEINNEPFNAMQGTPTTRNLFFASGGSEFVVQMDAEFQSAKTANRTYNMSFGAVECDQNTIVCPRPCGGHTSGKPPVTTYRPGDDCACPQILHSDHGKHYVSDTSSWTQSIEGFSYMKIKDAKVWKLAQGRVDGMYYLTDQDEFYADVQSVAPEAMWNIAQEDTAAQGRLYHSFDQNKMLDNYIFPSQSSNNSCTGHGNANMETLKSKIASINGGKDKVTAVSDYLVLRTTNGDQSILYYEYDSDTEVPIYKQMTVTPTSPSVGTTNGTINVTADPIKFTKATTQDMMWKNNGMTSENIKMKPGDITYGGYNGNYMNMSTKYKSTSGSAQNITLTSLTVNKPGYSKGSVSNPGANVPTKPSSIFKLMNKDIDIPDETKENKEYILGFSDVFYQNILNYGENVPNYPVTANPGKYSGNGFVLNTTYSPTHDKINDVVVHNPVSTQYAMTLSLPSDRDQRTDTYKDLEVMKPVLDETCPNISTECEYAILDCKYTGGHIHTDACYVQTEVPKHGTDNTHNHTEACYHVHTEACGRDTTGWTHIHCIDECREFEGYCTGEGCDLCALNFPFINNTFPSSGGDSMPPAYSCGYTEGQTVCGDLPLNAHDCSKGSVTTTVVRSIAHSEWDSSGNHASTSVSNNKLTFNMQGSDPYVFGPYLNLIGDSADMLRIKISSNGGAWAGQLYYDTNQGDHGEDRVTYFNVSGTQEVLVPMGKGWAGAAIGLVRLDFDGTAGTSIVIDSVDIIRQTEDTGGGSTCYTTKVMTLKCSESHHGFGSGWQVYTKGLLHKNGATCTGTGCNNNTDLQMTTGKWVTVNALANGHIVRHSGGTVHVSSNSNQCDYCGGTVKDVLGRSSAGTGTLLTTTEHNAFGDPTCYRPCNNNNNHKKLPTTSTDNNGNTVKAGEFINLDYEFTLYFPNKGDFYGNGAQASGSTSKTPGHGYIDGMDTTEWTRSKYVIFPFNVVSMWDNKSHQSGSPIFLDVPTEYFKFYCVLNNSEMASARITYHSIAINNIYDMMDNSLPTNYDRKAYLAAKHSAYKEQFIDVVGRIGAMTIEDTGDFRFSNLFKQALSPVQWLVNQVVKKVDYGVQNKIVADTYDVRGQKFSSVTNKLDTYGVRPERRQDPIPLPLTPSKNNIQALVKQPVRLGYNVFADLITLGNYYGENPDADFATNRKVQITPYYYHLNLNTGKWTPVDVYMNVNKVYRAINLFGNEAEANYPFKTPLNWLEEAKRRNYNGQEKDLTEAVVDAYSTDTDRIGQPQGSHYEFGTAQRFHLKERNRTFIGTEFPNTINRDPSNLFDNIVANRQGQRWHFTVGLPSSSVFVKQGLACTQTNIEDLRKNPGVIVCALDITSSGEVWNLKYKGDNINQPFKVTPDSPTYDPSGGPGTPPGDKPIITVFSVDKSSKDDLGIEGTQ